jgi:hypothetical protein
MRLGDIDLAKNLRTAVTGDHHCLHEDRLSIRGVFPVDLDGTIKRGTIPRYSA